jgi:hypothetical protein
MQLLIILHTKANCSIDGIERSKMGSSTGSNIGGLSKTHQQNLSIIGSHDPPVFNRQTIVAIISPVDKP